MRESRFFQNCGTFCFDLCWKYHNYERIEICATAQCCVFNNSSIVKHRHQIWDQFVIPVFKTEITNWSWILPQFTSLIRKLALVFFFWWIFGFSKKKFFQPSFRKKKLFIYKQNLSESTLLFQNFMTYIFALLIFFIIMSFHSVLWHLSFFLMEKRNKNMLSKIFFWFFCQTFATSPTSYDQNFDLSEGY